MDQLPNSGEIRCCQIVCKTLLLQEAAAEAVVPDSMPDVERILDADCALYIRSRQLENGCVTLEGNVRGTVLYVGVGEAAPQKLELELPLTMTAQEEALRTAETIAVNAALRSCEAKAVHSRRLQLRAEAAAEVTAFAPETLDFSLRCDAPEELETLVRTEEIGYIAAVTEKSFVVTDEVTLPNGAAPIDRILTSRLTARSRETKPVASRLLLQGEAALELVYLAPGDARMHSASFTVPFSQIMDAPEEEPSLALTSLLPSSAYVEPLPGLNGANSVSLELHLTAQTVCAARREIEYVADAYCLRRPCRIERAERTVFAPFEPFELSQTLSDVVDLPEKGGEVLFCAASAALPVRTDGSVRLTAAVHAAYAPEDAAPDTVVRRLQAEWRREADAAASLCAVPSVYDTAALIRGDTLELRCGVTVPYMSAAEKTLRFVRAAEPDERPGAERGEGPSAVVVRAGKRTAWELAKRYGSTVALIEAVNPADAPLWLIPRAR